MKTSVKRTQWKEGTKQTPTPKIKGGEIFYYLFFAIFSNIM